MNPPTDDEIYAALLLIAGTMGPVVLSLACLDAAKELFDDEPTEENAELLKYQARIVRIAEERKP